MLFHTILRRVGVEATNPEGGLLINQDRKSELQNILMPCQTALDMLNHIMQKNNGLHRTDLDRNGLAVFCQSISFGNVEMQGLHMVKAKMVTGTSAISLFFNTIAMGSLGRIEQKMNGDLKSIKLAVNEELARLMSVSSNESDGSVLTRYGDDDRTVWKEFRRSLIKKCFNSKLLDRKKKIILGYIIELGESDLLNDDSFETSSSASSTLEIISSSEAISNRSGDFANRPCSTGARQSIDKATFKPPGTPNKVPRKRRRDEHRKCDERAMGLWARGTVSPLAGIQKNCTKIRSHSTSKFYPSTGFHVILILR